LASTTVPPGGRLQLSADMLLVEPPRRPYAMVARLRDWRGGIRGEARALVPTEAPPDHRATLSFDITADAALPIGLYDVELSLFNVPEWQAVELTQPAHAGHVLVAGA